MDYEVEILLVEDSVADAELTIRALKKANLANKLVHLGDGADAVLNTTQHPKVILLDIKMPRVDGIEVLRQIRENETTRLIPVVIMTSSNEEQDIITSYSLGVNSYVVKPVGFEGFAKAVGELGLYWLLTNRVVTDF